MGFRELLNFSARGAGSWKWNTVPALKAKNVAQTAPVEKARSPARVLLGKIVNGADTDNTLYHQPEGPGLEAIAEGGFAISDTRMITRSMPGPFTLPVVIGYPRINSSKVDSNDPTLIDAMRQAA